MSALREVISRVEYALRQEISRLDLEIQKVRTDLLKWTFAFWLGEVSIPAGLIIARR